METPIPYLSYLGIGAAIVGVVALLLWIGFAAMLSTATEGVNHEHWQSLAIIAIIKV